MKITEVDVTAYPDNESVREKITVRTVDQFFAECDAKVNTATMVLLPRGQEGKTKKSFLSRRKKVQVVRIGRYYTSASINPHPPRKFRFKSARAAKRFFNISPFLVGSAAQMVAIFGEPCK